MRKESDPETLIANYMREYWLLVVKGLVRCPDYKFSIEDKASDSIKGKFK